MKNQPTNNTNQDNEDLKDYLDNRGYSDEYGDDDFDYINHASHPDYRDEYYD